VFSVPAESISQRKCLSGSSFTIQPKQKYGKYVFSFVQLMWFISFVVDVEDLSFVLHFLTEKIRILNYYSFNAQNISFFGQ